MIYQFQHDSETGLFLLKPDARTRQEENYALGRISSLDLEVSFISEVMFNEDMVKRFYPHKQDNLFPLIVHYLERGLSMAVVVDGSQCNEKLNHLKLDMRKMFHHEGLYTGIHCSDDSLQAMREFEVIGIKHP